MLIYFKLHVMFLSEGKEMKFLTKKIIITIFLTVIGVCFFAYFIFSSGFDNFLNIPNEQENKTSKVIGHTINLQPLWIILTLLSISVAGLSAFVAFKFYNWRQKIDLSGALVPEEWAEYLITLAENINDQSIHLQKLTSDNLRLSRLVDTNQNKILELITSSKEILLTFQTSLQEKDDEINRLKIGYDFKIQKDLLNQLVQLHSNCIEIIEKNEVNKGLVNIEILLRDLLESSGVLISKPPIGTDFSAISDLIEVTGYSSDPSGNLQKGQISEVLTDYYLYDSGTRQTVLKPAKIKYFLADGDK